MIPIIPILAWTGGIAAGAKAVGSVVRGVGELVRGRPMAGLVQLAGGLFAPLQLVFEQCNQLGGDLYDAVMGPQSEPEGDVAPRRQRPPRHRQPSEQPSDNGVPRVVTEA